MTHATHYVAPEFGTLPVRFLTGNWSGYHANWNDNGYPNWTDVSTENPSVAGERQNDGHYIGFWDGFGGIGSGSYLTQIGTSLHDDGSYGGQGTILFFTEWVNPSVTCCSPQTIKNLSVSKGDDVYYDMTFLGPCGTCTPNQYTQAYFENITTGNYTSLYFASGDTFSNNSVEWEAEDASAPAWTSYKGESFNGSNVALPNTQLSSLTRVTDWMGYSGGQYYMKPSGLSGDNFNEVPQN
jgi:hypothetical protein